MISRYKNLRKNIIEKKININKEAKLQEIKTELQKFNKEVNSDIKKLETKEVDIKDSDEFYDLFKIIRDKQTYIKYYYEFMKNFFKDKKYKYNVIMFLNSGRIKGFNVFENPNIEGFNYNGAYYNIDTEAVVDHNKEAFVFYKEGIPSPINFKKSTYNNNTFDLMLSGENLKYIVEGKAFKGIIRLGKDEPKIDWKWIVIGLGILILVMLHVTGQIDLVQLLNLGGGK